MSGYNTHSLDLSNSTARETSEPPSSNDTLLSSKEHPAQPKTPKDMRPITADISEAGAGHEEHEAKQSPNKPDDARINLVEPMVQEESQRYTREMRARLSRPVRRRDDSGEISTSKKYTNTAINNISTYPDREMATLELSRLEENQALHERRLYSRNRKRRHHRTRNELMVLSVMVMVLIVIILAGVAARERVKSLRKAWDE